MESNQEQENYLARQLRAVQAMIDGATNHEAIRVVKTAGDEILAAGSLGVGGGQSMNPQALVFAPISIGLDGRIVVGDYAAIYGSFTDRCFSFDDFINYCDGHNLTTISGEEARLIVAYLRENPDIKKGPQG